MYDVVKPVLEQSPRILHELKDYQGANEQIREVCLLAYLSLNSLGCECDPPGAMFSMCFNGRFLHPESNRYGQKLYSTYCVIL